ncbi:DUF6873 family GME fold protein [Clostridium sp. BJN0001]|uniref:DUF6873 family GME fold protein n=1 Tax=Clostridium sp. BJN0001 TaxID=2930219 RepID=UPI0032AFB6D6
MIIIICFVDSKITCNELVNLKKLNLKIIKVPKCDTLYNAISSHPDIQLSVIKNGKSYKLIIQKDMKYDFLKDLENNNIKYSLSSSSLKEKYPSDIILNALITKDIFVHNIKYTDNTLLRSIDNREILNVNQGYTNCSVLKVSDNAFITSDLGIYNVLSSKNMDVLLLPFGDIILEDFEYGFIGGCGGLISKNEIVFFGTLQKYKYKDKVLDFLSKFKVTPIYLDNCKLKDRGGIITI